MTGQSAVTPNTPATGQPTIAGTLETGETLTAATSSISDDNGLANAAFAYQWIHTATDSEAYIPAATASSYLLSSDDLGHSIKVRVTFTDDDGYTERLTSSATALVVMPANVAATGQPTIRGTAEVGETLTAATSAISDSNGLTNTVFSHQWVRSANDSDNDITNATSSTYVVTNADVDKAIKVRVSFTDDDEYSETLTSNATTSVPVPAPVIVPPEEPQIAQAAGDAEVPDYWNLIPTGKGLGDRFRLIFLSSTERNATSSSINTYNTWIQTRAAAGHTALTDYSSLFKAVGCTDSQSARNNTSTTFTNSNKGVPIYWVNGNKVADDYEDFYDESWDDEANDKNESGTNGPDTSDVDNYPVTGCDHDGTKAGGSGVQSRALGSGGSVRLARPNDSGSDNGPLSSINNISAGSRPMYGLSPVFIVVELSDDAKLSTLVIEGATNGESISLSPAFTANRGNYTATVPNNIDAVSLTATKNESNATVAITNDDDTNTKNQAELDLIVGDTTLTVTVTAQDGSTKTYTITVTRSVAITLVSNTGQTLGNVAASIQSQPFTTGSHLYGYTLTSVNVGIQGNVGLAITQLFQIVPNKGNGQPNLSDPTKFITLTSPASTRQDKIHTFAAPADTKLAANTTYHLLLVNDTGGLPGNIHLVSSQDEDQGGAPSWSIGNTRYWKASTSESWSTSSSTIVRMQINGLNALPSTDATLSGLAMEDATGAETITLSPAFDEDTLTYTAAVANGIHAVTLTATKNHSGAMIAITDDDDANTKNEADLDLSVGANTLTVTVTAEDTSVTETYTITVTRAQDPTVPPTVLPTWSLVPSGLSEGDQFRLLFLSAIRRNGSSSDIADYNTFVQERAAAGHTDIQTYSNRFTAVGCTEAVDARDNTGTTYTNANKGAPIYWLNGNKVADDYEDFYDGDWDDEAAGKNELGTAAYDILQIGNRPLTGCSDDGTEKVTGTDSSALGNGGDVTVARPNSSGTGDGPLSSGQKIDKTYTRPMYALSQVFTVTAPADCPTDATWCTTMGLQTHRRVVADFLPAAWAGRVHQRRLSFQYPLAPQIGIRPKVGLVGKEYLGTTASGRRSQRGVLHHEGFPPYRVRLDQPLLGAFQHKPQPVQIVQATAPAQRQPEVVRHKLPHRLPVPVG